MPANLAPADLPSEEQFTFGNFTAELELEPRRANLLGAPSTTTPTGPPTGRTSPPTRPTAVPRERGYANSGLAS